MTDVVKKTTDGVLTILIWPVRILVILNTLIIPVLLGLIIYFYLKHQNEINDIIKRTITSDHGDKHFAEYTLLKLKEKK